MKILIIEDNPEKAADIEKVVRQANSPSEANIIVAPDSISAQRAMMESEYDVMFLDVILPKRPGDEPKPCTGMELLEAICMDELMKKPKYIVGITANETAFDEAHLTFSRFLWALLRYSNVNRDWEQSISNLIKYLSGNLIPEEPRFPVRRVDIAVVTALPIVEFGAIKALPINWITKRYLKDSTEYFEATHKVKGGASSLVAATATQMGMPAMASLCTKIISLYRPRYLVICGIAAGFRDSCELGDVIICDQTWDAGSGKVITAPTGRSFLPEPKVINLNGQLKDALVNYSTASAFTPAIESGWRSDKPSRSLSTVVGALVSGSAVIANAEEAKSYRQVNRKVVGLDMETYAVYYAAQHSFQPCPHPLAIKSVCDFADADKGDSAQSYAAYTSASYFYHLLCDGFFIMAP